MIKINIAVVGATGLVGQTFLKALENVSFNSLELFTSKKSKGKEITVQGKVYKTQELTEGSFHKGIDYAFFFAGGEISEEYVPKAAKLGIIAIDNSSFFRMKEGVPLIVPEVNPHKLKGHGNIIANPNCTTIQAVCALKPLHDKFGLKRVIVSTYQAVSGAGIGAVKDLDENTTNVLKYPIKNNLFPEIDVITENGYTKEEIKIINETRKILELKELKITSTCVRVPVENGHSESITIELEKEFTIEEVIKTLEAAKGVKLKNIPQPLNAADNDDVFVGRIRKDDSAKNSLNIFTVSNNIRKGAATNALQIMNLLEGM